MAIKMYNGSLGYSKVVHVILEDSKGKETLCGIKSIEIQKTDKPVTCKFCQSDAQKER